MKRLIYTIGILMFLSAPVHPWIGFAEDSVSPDPATCVPNEDVTCAEAIQNAYALKDSAEKNLEWGQSFGETDPKKVGQNLYLMVYKKASGDTLSEAIIATANQYGIPPGKMSMILSGNIKPILERAPLMTVERATDIYNQIIRTYNDKKESADLQATIEAMFVPNEMFSDGDLDNSGFDLINDLDNIEIILFQKADEVSFGGDYSGPGSEKGGVTPPTPPIGENIPVPIDLNGPGGGGGGDQPVPAKPEAAKPNLNNPFQQADEDKGPVFVGGVNPNQCFATQDLDQALDNFSQDAQTNSKLKSRFDPAKDLAKIDKSPGSANKGNSSGPAGGSGLNVPIPGVSDVAPTPNVPEAPAGDYSQPALCDDIICLTIEFIEKPVTPGFNKTDNCIQCHVQYINDGLRKTLSHNLIPGKASGNLGESGLCKNSAGISLGRIGMSVNLSIVPIVTPVKNDLMSLGNIGDEWDKYASKYGGWNYDEKKKRDLVSKATGKPVDTSPLMSDVERMLEVQLANSNDNTTIGQIMAQTADGYDAKKARETQEQLVAEVANDAYGEIDTLRVLDEQMQQMNQFFEGFKNQIRTLNEDVPGLNSSKACVKLQNKQQCT